MQEPYGAHVQEAACTPPSFQVLRRAIIKKKTKKQQAASAAACGDRLLCDNESPRLHSCLANAVKEALRMPRSVCFCLERRTTFSPSATTKKLAYVRSSRVWVCFLSGLLKADGWTVWPLRSFRDERVSRGVRL